MKVGLVIHHDPRSCRSLLGVKYDDRTTTMDFWLIGSFADAFAWKIKMSCATFRLINELEVGMLVISHNVYIHIFFYSVIYIYTQSFPKYMKISEHAQVNCRFLLLCELMSDLQDDAYLLGRSGFFSDTPNVFCLRNF